jgi:hypothetical protein
VTVDPFTVSVHAVLPLSDHHEAERMASELRGVVAKHLCDRELLRIEASAARGDELARLIERYDLLLLQLAELRPPDRPVSDANPSRPLAAGGAAPSSSRTVAASAKAELGSFDSARARRALAKASGVLSTLGPT